MPRSRLRKGQTELDTPAFILTTARALPGWAFCRAQTTRSQHDGSICCELRLAHRGGFVVPVGSKTMLAQRIIFLLKNPQVREKIGKRCRKYVLKTQNREKDGQRWLELSYKTVKLAQRMKSI